MLFDLKISFVSIDPVLLWVVISIIKVWLFRILESLSDIDFAIGVLVTHMKKAFKFLFENSRNIYAIKSHKIKDFSEIIISQTSSLIYDFLKMKKFFFVVDFDYKSDLLNKRILNKTISLNRKKTHEKVITFKI